MFKIKLLILSEKSIDKKFIVSLSKNKSFSITSFKKDDSSFEKFISKKTDVVLYLSKDMVFEDTVRIKKLKQELGKFVPFLIICKNKNLNIEPKIDEMIDFSALENEISPELLSKIIVLSFEKYQAELKSFQIKAVDNLNKRIDNLSSKNNFDDLSNILIEEKLFNSALIISNPKKNKYGLANVNLDFENIEDFLKQNYIQNILTNDLYITNNVSNWIYPLEKNEHFKSGFVKKNTTGTVLALTSNILDFQKDYPQELINKIFETIDNKKTPKQEKDLDYDFNSDNFALFFVEYIKRNKQFKVKHISENFSDITGLRHEQTNDLTEWITHFYGQNSEFNVLNLFEEDFEDTLHLKHPEKDEIWLKLHIIPTKNNEKILLRGIIYDITDIKKSEIFSQKQRDYAINENKKRAALMLNFSYDLRTSMNSILGFSTLMSSDNLASKKRKKYGNIIKESVNKLMNVIDNILEVSKLESEDYKIQTTECPVMYFMKDIELKYTKLLENNENLDFVLISPENTEKLVVNTDTKKIKQVFDILIDNSIKFTNEGTITIGFECNIELKQIVFYVKDTGKGIPENEQSTIFERYKYSNQADFNKGAGVGLGVAKGIVEKMNGKIWFETYPDEGTDFYFSLPVESCSKTEKKEVFIEKQTNSTPTDFEGLSIFVAEDDDFAFEFIAEILEPLKIIFKRAEDGERLMEMLEKEKEPDIILLDIKMPKKNGIECYEEIKSKGIKSKIIVQTAFGIDNKNKKFFNSGDFQILRKPLDPDKLIDTIYAVIKN